MAVEMKAGPKPETPEVDFENVEALIAGATSFLDLEARLRAGNAEIIGSDGLAHKTKQLMDIVQDVAKDGEEVLVHATSRMGFRGKLQELLVQKNRKALTDRSLEKAEVAPANQEGAGAEFVEGATSLLEIIIGLHDGKLNVQKGDGSIYDANKVVDAIQGVGSFGLRRIGTVPRALGLRKKVAELWRLDQRQGR
jgi:hypothetical protein